jgi:hypothetical protein
MRGRSEILRWLTSTHAEDERADGRCGSLAVNLHYFGPPRVSAFWGTPWLSLSERHVIQQDICFGYGQMGTKSDAYKWCVVGVELVPRNDNLIPAISQREDMSSPDGYGIRRGCIRNQLDLEKFTEVLGGTQPKGERSERVRLGSVVKNPSPILREIQLRRARPRNDASSPAPILPAILQPARKDFLGDFEIPLDWRKRLGGNWL